MSLVTNRKIKERSTKPSIAASTKEDEKVQDIRENSRDTPAPPLLPQKSIARFVTIMAVLVIVYYTTKQDKLQTFAKQSDSLPGRGQSFDCSEEYRKELNEFDGCLPADCGRFVTDKLGASSEADALLEIAKKGLAFGGSAGGASILDLHSGALSKGSVFIDIYKTTQAKNLFTEADFNVYMSVKAKVQHAIAQHFGVYTDKIYLTHPTFFSRITDRPALTVHDEYWHPHVDKETYKSFHYTSLLYLNDYKEDFTGGRFVFVDEKVNRTVEPRKGRVSMFTSGAENLHYVEKVTSGVRYALTISFTCDKTFAITDPSIDKYK